MEFETYAFLQRSKRNILYTIAPIQLTMNHLFKAMEDVFLIVV